MKHFPPERLCSGAESHAAQQRKEKVVHTHLPRRWRRLVEGIPSAMAHARRRFGTSRCQGRPAFLPPGCEAARPAAPLQQGALKQCGETPQALGVPGTAAASAPSSLLSHSWEDAAEVSSAPGSSSLRSPVSQPNPEALGKSLSSFS